MHEFGHLTNIWCSVHALIFEKSCSGYSEVLKKQCQGVEGRIKSRPNIDQVNEVKKHLSRLLEPDLEGNLNPSR